MSEREREREREREGESERESDRERKQERGRTLPERNLQGIRELSEGQLHFHSHLHENLWGNNQ